MEWCDFRKRAIALAREQNISPEMVKEYLSYAHPLIAQQLPVIVNAKSLAKLIGIDFQYLCNMAYGTSCFYRSFTITKKNGTNRIISEPLPDLKFVQNWILKNILQHVPVTKYAKAFKKGGSIKENARFHRGQKSVVSLDVKNFFPSITLTEIFIIFHQMGYYENVSWFLGHLCCLNGTLPQGAPTSPYLSNLRMAEFDRQIVLYAKEKEWRYTRYADDLTFSGNGNEHELVQTVSNLLLENDLYPNIQKTRIIHQNARQTVTGIVVNQKMQVSRAYRRRIRQEVYYIKKYGIDSHLQHCCELRKNYLSHLLGKIEYALFINPRDKALKEECEIIRNLMQKTDIQ